MTMFYTLFSLSMGCAVDKQVVRQDDQEQALLRQSANRHWEGRRWNIPDRAAYFYEDPLVRARKAGQLKGEYRRLVEVAILHVKVDPKRNATDTSGKKTEANWLRTGTVWVRIEGIGRDNVLRVEEKKQDWYRTSQGWWLQVKKDASKADK